MILYSALFLTIWSTFVDYSVGQQCNAKGMQRYDSVFAKLLTLGGSGRTFPEDKQGQLKKYCDQSFDYIKDIEKYKDKCMKNMSKQVTGVVIYSVRTAINKYCKKDSKRQDELISGFTCANRAKKEIDQCYTVLIDSFQGAINAKDTLRVPHTCCQYFRLFECIKEKSMRNKACDEVKVETFSGFVRELFGNVVDLICTDYTEGSDKCDKLGSPPKKKKSQRRTKSFMVPLVETLASL